MNMLKRKNEGITLIALVITIVILIILAGISISALTGSGLFKNAEKAKERTIKAQLKEEIEMAIQEIQIEEISKENNVTLETLANGQLQAKFENNITAEIVNNEITGEYKDYDYTIDSKFKVKIGEKSGGIKPTGVVEILTNEYMFEGDGTVEIKVTASIAEGTITEIKAPKGITEKTDISTSTEKTYIVSKNGIYVFTIVGDNGRETDVIAKVENILNEPQVKIDEITTEGFKINVENDYPEGAITEYKYFVEGEIKNQGTTNKNYVVTGLDEETEYSDVKVTAYIQSTGKDSNIEKITTKGAWSEKYRTTSDYTDAYGNVAKIPEGFQVSTKKGQTNLNEGLVVRNATDKNEFVWIPVPKDGKVYTNKQRTEYKTIKLNRYTFDNGNPIAKNDTVINNFCQEAATSIYGNTTAKDIETFKTNATKNKGYYIGRYEARKNSSGKITEIGTDNIYNFVTQPNAAIAARNMYDNTKPFISDLINSYAWDTAIVFLQECGDNPTYSIKTSVNTGTPISTGTNNQETKDVQCNVYDMASNILEWTTETSNLGNGLGSISRGGSAVYGGNTGTRSIKPNSTNEGNYGFRPILYLNN